MSAATNEVLQVYSQHQRGEETVRETEARALLSCASRLEKARRPDSNMEDYAAAIKHNQQLWTIFQVCLCEPDNALPRDLKILLLNISNYIDKASFRLIADYKPDGLKSLIDINRHIAAGLSVKPQNSAAASLAQPAAVSTSI